MKHLSIQEHKLHIMKISSSHLIPKEADISLSPRIFEARKSYFDLEQGIVVGKNFVEKMQRYAKSNKISLLEANDNVLYIKDVDTQKTAATIEIYAGKLTHPLLFNPFYLNLAKISPKTCSKRSLIYLSLFKEVYLIKRKNFYLSIYVDRN